MESPFLPTKDKQDSSQEDAEEELRRVEREKANNEDRVPKNQPDLEKPTTENTSLAWHRNTPPAEPVGEPKAKEPVIEEDPWELRLEQVKYFTLFISNECKAEKREPHMVEIRLLARELEALRGRMQEELVLSSIQTFVDKFSGN